MHRRPALTRLLVLLLLMQWGTAFGQGLHPAAPDGGFAVGIGTPDGLHRVVLPGGKDVPGADQATVAACPACLGPDTVALPVPEVGVAPPPRLAQAADPPAPEPPPLPPPPAPSCRPRAPPIS